MIGTDQFRNMAMDLPGTVEKPHFDRAAFRVRRNYATLAGDAKTANLKLTPEEQEIICALHGPVFTPVPNKWGQQGWTTVYLNVVSPEVLQHALHTAWQGGSRK